jgi:hypothetical protein
MSDSPQNRKNPETAEEREQRIEREAKEYAEAGLERDKLNVAQNTVPFTRFKAAEMILCAAAVILGLLYLYTNPKVISLDILLPVYTAVFVAIVPLRWMDLKATGVKGGFAVLTTVVWGVIALVVAAATAVYFVWYRT